MSDNAVTTPNAEQPLTSTPRANLSVEQAITQLRERREESRAPAPKPEAKPERASQRAATETTADDGTKWTDQEAVYIARLQVDEAQWKTDYQRFMFDSRLDLNALERTNKGEAAAKRVELANAEIALKERAQRILKAREALGAIELDRHARKVMQFLATQKEIVDERLPNLDKAQLRTYLLEQGFGETEVSQVFDARVVVMAEKARRYDALAAKDKKPQLTVPRLRPNAQQRVSEVTASQTNLKRTGSIDDAVALLQAKRRARASR
jgi:hypothetical protein